MVLSKVVLPQPLGPIRLRNSPALTAMSMPTSACIGPKLFDTPSIAMPTDAAISRAT